MQTALKIQTTVTAEGKIEISMPELPPGKPVEVIILLPEQAANGEPVISQQRSALDILNQAPGGRQFKTAAEVTTYLRRERDTWDN